MKFFGLFCCLFVGGIFFSQAQLCSGSLGDPIVNVTFGIKTTRLPKEVTTYEFMNGCPEKGRYTTSNFLLGCGNRTWVLLVGDHTRNENGAYMLVNAESTPGSVYTDTANGLCGNTSYQFTAWVTNVLQKISCGGKSILPNLTFTVLTLSGQILASYDTGDLPIEDEKKWKLFGLTFKTPASIHSAVLKITTNPIYGCGSAFAIDDITFSVCSPATVGATIDGSTGSKDVCADYTDPFILQGAYSPGFADPLTQWQSSIDTGKTWQDIPGETKSSYAVPRRTSGEVLFRIVAAERSNISSVNCRVSSNTIYTNVHSLPKHQPPADIIGCIGKDLILPGTEPEALAVLFTGPNGYISDQPKSIVANVQYADTGLYLRKQTFYFGCTSTDTFYLKVFPGTTINASPLYSVCENSAVTLSAFGQGKFKWVPSAGLSNDTLPNPVAQPGDSTEYKVTVTNAFGCKDSAYVQVNVFRNPYVNAGSDVQILAGDSVTLAGVVRGTAVNFSWSPFTYIKDGNSLSPTVFPPQDLQYSLQATSNVGCGTVVSKINIRVYKDIFVPGAFTPNGDGINDRFNIIGPDNYKVIKYLVYNRWGEVIYKAVNFKNGWDGTFKNMPQPVATYSYYVQLRSPLGKTLVKKGAVALLR